MGAGAWLDRLAGPLLDAGLGAGAWLGVIALAMVACRQPARRLAMARVGAVGVLAIGPLCWIGAAPRIDVVGPIRAAGPPSWTRADPGPAAGVGARPAAFRRLPTRTLTRWATAGYLAGMGAGLAWLLLGWWGAGRLARRSVVPSRGARALYDELTGSIPPRRRPRLRVAPRARRPGVLGGLRPTIVIPPELDRPAARERLRLCLLHELAHVERGDPWAGLAGSLAQALWFPWPQAWWVRAQLRLDQEFLADRRAAADFGTAGTYAASLVDLADPGAGPPSAPAPAPAPATTPATTPARAPASPGSDFVRRVLMLVRCPFPVEDRPPLWWRRALPPAAVLGVLIASGLTLRGLPPTPPPSPGPGPGGHTFRMPRLSLPEAPAGRPSPPIPWQLPLAQLPTRFELTLDAWADDAVGLAQIRILGLALDVGPLRDPEPPGWHTVRIVRTAEGLSLWVDGRILLDRAPPGPGRNATAFTIQPAPRGPAEFRNLKLVW